jgi:antitoxin component YwqK of YwqJK toxin-antitoxin module
MKSFRLLLFFAFLFSASLFAQTDTLNRIDAKGKKQGYWKKYDKEILIYEGRFMNDVPVGEFKYYHINGNLKSISLFLNGTHKVKTTLYDETGKKSAEGLFVDQQKDGIWNYYSANNYKIKEESYKNGVKDGSWKTYSAQTGILLEEETYSDGVLNGVKKTYYTDGELNTSLQYINGKMNGVVEAYHPDNILLLRGMYHNDQQIGTWDYYDINGKKIKSIEYEKSTPVRTYLYLTIGGAPQKLSLDGIAYFRKVGNKINVVTANSKTLVADEQLETIKQWVDIVDFVPVNPSFLVSYNALKGYQELENGQILVKLKPAPSTDVIAEGEDAKFVKSLFNKEIPKEE